MALYYQTKLALCNQAAFAIRLTKKESLVNMEIPVFKCLDGYSLGKNETMAIYNMLEYLPTE
jgi:hypothetical protein